MYPNLNPNSKEFAKRFQERLWKPAAEAGGGGKTSTAFNDVRTMYPDLDPNSAEFRKHFNERLTSKAEGALTIQQIESNYRQWFKIVQKLESPDTTQLGQIIELMKLVKGDKTDTVAANVEKGDVTEALKEARERLEYWKSLLSKEPTNTETGSTVNKEEDPLGLL